MKKYLLFLGLIMLMGTSVSAHVHDMPKAPPHVVRPHMMHHHQIVPPPRHIYTGHRRGCPLYYYAGSHRKCTCHRYHGSTGVYVNLVIPIN